MAIDFGKRMGMGGLRLPVLDPMNPMGIDFETLEKNVDYFMDHGFNYFDTAFIYHGEKSEEAYGKAVVSRYPRDKFLLSTKMPIKQMNSGDELEPIFQKQLENCQVDYFDFYLIHCISRDTYTRCKEWKVFEFLMEKKKQGKFKEFGVSLHDSPEFLEEVLKEHPEIDFVMLQINFLDWVNPSIRAKENYEIACKYNKPIVVMEACKGGTLANLPDEAVKLMKDYNPEASLASWAYRFVGSLPGVRVVLCGMPTFEFMVDDVETFDNFKPLNDEERAILDKVVEIVNEKTPIPCTQCRYCEPKCPMNIAIADYFALYNDLKRLPVDAVMTQAMYYGALIEQGHGPASACVNCEACVKQCPQHLTIPEYLTWVKKDIEEYNPLEEIEKMKAAAQNG